MKITQANAEAFVRARYPKVRCQTVTGFDRSRSYMIYLDGGRAGEMYIAYADRKPAAWKEAAVRLQEREEREVNAAKDPAITDEQIRELWSDPEIRKRWPHSGDTQNNREFRARCAEILNARAASKAGGK